LENFLLSHPVEVALLVKLEALGKSGIRPTHRGDLGDFLMP
jgi:hypothetical protein